MCLVGWIAGTISFSLSPLCRVTENGSLDGIVVKTPHPCFPLSFSFVSEYSSFCLSLSPSRSHWPYYCRFSRELFGCDAVRRSTVLRLDSNIRRTIARSISQPVAHLNLKGHAGRVNDVAWHRDESHRCISTDSEGGVRVWDLSARKCVAQLDMDRKDVLHAAWAPSGQVLAVSTRDDYCVVFDCKTWKRMAQTKLSGQVRQQNRL